MRFAVDARWMIGQTRGMARYAQVLIEPIKQEINALLPKGSLPADYKSAYGSFGYFPYWEQRGLSQLCSKHNIQYLICPYNTAPLKLPQTTKLILVVHDLIYLETRKQLPLSASMYQNLGRLYRRMIVPKVIQKAHRLITVSHYTRRQINQIFNIPETKMTLIPNSITDDWRVLYPLPEAEREPYMLMVSGNAPHKNVSRLLHAFAAFKRLISGSDSSPKLHIVGIKIAHQYPFQALVNALGIKDSVIFEPYIDQSDLKILYQRARLFVFPSIIEGGGIPLLEAMASGTPIVCSHTSVFPEIIGDTGWFFNPLDINDMTNTLCAAWADRHMQTEFAWRGLDRVQHFSQRNCTESIRAFWRDL